MKQIFTNLCAVDDIKISKEDIFVNDGIICKKFDENEADEIIDCGGLFLVPSLDRKSTRLNSSH